MLRRALPHRCAVVLLCSAALGLAGCSSDDATEPARASATGEVAGNASLPAVTAPAGTSSPADDAPAATDPPLPTDADTQVVLSYAAWDPGSAAVVAGGYVTPQIEDGGTCTLRLSKGGTTVTATSPGVGDATTTACGNLSVPRARLATGTWTAVLEYRSGSASGSSSTIDVEVPA